MEKRCGLCRACVVFEKTSASIMRYLTTAHADDDVVTVWNCTLEQYPCEQPMKVVKMTPQEQEELRKSMEYRLMMGKVICGIPVGRRHLIEKETWRYYDAHAEGLGYTGVLVKHDYSALLYDVPAEVLEHTKRY